jgi:iron-sulfur cluster assembly accessory protein
MITVTENAKQKIISILNEENAEFIRFGLRGGGCNGFTYFLQIETNSPEEDDTVITLDDRALLVDSMSLMYLNDAEIDYKKDLMGESFVFNNPNITGHCGCGSSVNF